MAIPLEFINLKGFRIFQANMELNHPLKEEDLDSGQSNIWVILCISGCEYNISWTRRNIHMAEHGITVYSIHTLALHICLHGLTHLSLPISSYLGTLLTTPAVFLSVSPGSIFSQPKQITTHKIWNVEPTKSSPELIHFIFGDGTSPILLSHFEPWNKTLKHLFHTENYVHNNSCFFLCFFA